MEKLMAKKNLVTIDEYLQTLQKAHRVVELIQKRSVKTRCHKRAIAAKATMVGLGELMNDLKRGQSMCLEILGAKKVTIVVEEKLKLVVNNEKGGKR